MLLFCTSIKLAKAYAHLFAGSRAGIRGVWGQKGRKWCREVSASQFGRNLHKWAPSRIGGGIAWWKGCLPNRLWGSLWKETFREVLCVCVYIHGHRVERQGQMERSLKVHLSCVWKPNQKSIYRSTLIKGVSSPSNRITQLKSLSQHREN